MRALDRGGIVARIGCGVLRLDVHYQADLVRAFGPVRLHRRAVGPHQVVAGDRRLVLAALAGREHAMPLAARAYPPRPVGWYPPLPPSVARAVHNAAGTA